MGVQVVRINTDLLQLQPAPSASESRIGGADLIGAKVAAQASVRTATIRKDRFIVVLLFFGSAEHLSFLSSVGFSQFSRTRENGFVQWGPSFRGRVADETTSQDRDRKPGMLVGGIWAT